MHAVALVKGVGKRSSIRMLGRYTALMRNGWCMKLRGRIVDHRIKRAACGASLAAFIVVLAGCRLDTKGQDSILAAFQGPSVGDAALMAVDPYSADNRYKGTLIIGSQPFAGEELYMRLFLANINDPDPRVRIASMRAIANHGRPEHAPLLINGLSHPDALVRIEAARGLQRLYNEDAIDPLVIASKEPDLEKPEEPAETSAAVRVEAVDALGQYADDRCVQALVAALNDSDLAVNRAAQNSLRTLTGQDFGLSQRQWLDWYEDTKSPFANRAVYEYNAFSRPKKWYEHIPFVPPPPNEPTSSPNGYPLGGVK